jgi:hypothetical protein
MGAPVQCIFCGTSNGPRDQFCRLCRSPLRTLTEAAPVVAPPDATPAIVRVKRSHLVPIAIAVSLVLVASATALGARGPLLDLASHVLPGVSQQHNPASTGHPPTPTVKPGSRAPAGTTSAGAAATCRPAGSKDQGKGLAKGRESVPCPTATPRPHGPDRTPGPQNTKPKTTPRSAKPHATSTPQARGDSSSTQDVSQAQRDAPTATSSTAQQVSPTASPVTGTSVTTTTVTPTTVAATTTQQPGGHGHGTGSANTR